MAEYTPGKAARGVPVCAWIRRVWTSRASRPTCGLRRITMEEFGLERKRLKPLSARLFLERLSEGAFRKLEK